MADPTGRSLGLIEAKGLKKIYKMGAVEVEALRGIDLTIYPGDFYSIMGASGSGKSSLLHILGCLDTPSEGEYLLNGQSIASLDDTELSKIRSQYIGFIFQAYNLLPQLSVYENVALPFIYRKEGFHPPKERILNAIDRVGLSHRVDHRPKQLSGGEEQRVAIARSLVIDPILVLADEPTGNLDSKTGENVLQLFCKLNREGTTIVLVTHDAKVAGYTKKKIVLADGKIISEQ